MPCTMCMHSAVEKTYFANRKHSLQNTIQTFSHTKHTYIFHFGICHAANMTDHDSKIQLCRTINNLNGKQTQMQLRASSESSQGARWRKTLHDFDVWCFFVFLSHKYMTVHLVLQHVRCNFLSPVTNAAGKYDTHPFAEAE